MKNIHKSIILVSVLLLSLFYTSCTEEVHNQDLPFGNTRLMVEGTISTDTISHKVVLSRSGNPLDTSQYFVSGATVSITDGINVFPLTEDPLNRGTYYTAPDVYGVAGRTYVLNISNVDLYGNGSNLSFAASSELRDENSADSISLEYNDQYKDNEGWYVNLYALDGGGGINYYLIKIRKNNVLVTDTTTEYTFTSSTGFEGKYFDGIAVYWLSKYKDDEVLSDGDTVTLELYGITQGYYDFLRAFIEESYPKTPIFSGPSANIPSNVTPEDISYGYFAAYSIKRTSKIYHP
jgi:hypothetical protein